MAAYEELFTKTPSTGAKIDIVLAMIRIQMFFDDKHGVKQNIDRAQRYVRHGEVPCYALLTPSLKAR